MGNPGIGPAAPSPRLRFGDDARALPRVDRRFVPLEPPGEGWPARFEVRRVALLRERREDPIRDETASLVAEDGRAPPIDDARAGPSLLVRPTTGRA
jgi:hypothetical protein